MLHNDLKYVFIIESVSFQISTISLGKISKAVPPHAHGLGCYEIHYNLAGCGFLVAGGKTHNIHENTLYITGPNIMHEQIPASGQCMTEYCLYLRIFPTSEFRPNQKSFLSPFLKQPFWIGEDTQNILPLLQTIFLEFEQKKPGYQSLLTALFHQLTIHLIRNYPDACFPCPADEKNERDKNYLLEIEKTFLKDYRTITLPQLAERINLSTRQTERLLQQHYNRTFMQKRAEARIGAASILLKSTELPISAIAEMTGYSSSEHFSHAFKTFTGISAREYRAQLEQYLL